MRAFFLSAIFLFFSSIPAIALGQSDQKSLEALATIGSFAREFCLAADSASSSTTVELSGEAKIKLNALIQKIAGLEIGGGAKYIDTSTTGVLQRDLAAAFADTNKCRLNVLAILSEKLLPTTTVDPSASKFAGPWRDASDATTFYDVTVQGQNFHSVEYGRTGRPVASMDGVISQGNVVASSFVEPTPPGEKLMIIPERTLIGTANMRLSDDEKRIVGTFVTKNKNMAVKFEWVRR